MAIPLKVAMISDKDDFVINEMNEFLRAMVTVYLVIDPRELPECGSGAGHHQILKISKFGRISDRAPGLL